MTFQNDREIKEKWLRKYQEEIALHREQAEMERLQKIKEGREFLERIRREQDEENARRQQKKKAIIDENNEEYLRYLQRKRMDDMRNFEERRRKENVSLEMKSEERLNGLKSYLNHLSDKVDKNMNNFMEYKDYGLKE